MAAAISIPPGFPDAATTGVPTGTVLTAYTGPTTITKAGTVIEGKIIDGGLVINAPNVTIKNCIIKNGYWWGIDGEHGGSTLVVQNCDIIGPGIEGNSGILGTGTFIGNDISGYENGIMSSGGSNGVFSGNYIHDLKSTKADPHFTGIQVQGGENNLRIENNTVMNDNDSNIFLQALYGPISNVIINNNYVGGSASGNNSYNIYVESRFGYPVTDVAITNNYIDKGYYGYFSIVNSSPKMSGNVLFDTDHGIFPPGGGTGTPPTDPVPPKAPTIASFSQDTGVAGDNITKDNTLTLTGTAAANSVVKVLDGSVQVGSAVANGSGQWTLTTSALDDGAHSLTATSANAAASASAVSKVLSVTIDTKAPGAPTMGVYSQSGATLGSTTTLDDLTLKGTAEANSAVKVFDGTKQIGTATANGSGAWSLDVDDLGKGAHSFTATATDIAGNASTASPAKSVSVTAPTAPAESIEFTSLSETWKYTTIKGTADPNSHIKLYDGKMAIGTVTAGADGTWTFRTQALSDKVHTITAREVDSSGKVIASSSGQAIVGSSKGNLLTGTDGDDYLVGKGTSDTFVFAPQFGNDVVKDFDATGRGHDTIKFSASVFDSFASVLAHASQVGKDVVIASGSDTLTLKNVKLSSLDSGDFHFA